MKKLTKKFFYLFLLGFLPAVAQDVHIVKKGEIVSRIIQKYYHLPVNKLYNGKLKEIKKLNPHIKDIDLIYPGQKIYLKPQVEPSKLVARKPQSVEPLEDSFVASFDYGFEYFKYKQETENGTFNTQIILPNMLGLNFNFDSKNYGLNGKYRAVKFKFKDNLEKETESAWVNRFELGGNYKLFTARFEFNQEPVFAITPLGRIDLFTQTTIWFMAGVTDKNQIKSNKEMFYRYSFLVGVPLTTGNDSSTGDLKSQSGFKLDVEGDFNRELASWENSNLFLSLGLGFYYQYQKFETDSSIYNRETKINLFKTDFLISLKYGF